MISVRATLAEANPKGAKLTILPQMGSTFPHEGDLSGTALYLPQEASQKSWFRIESESIFHMDIIEMGSRHISITHL